MVCPIAHYTGTQTLDHLVWEAGKAPIYLTSSKIKKLNERTQRKWALIRSNITGRGKKRSQKQYCWEMRYWGRGKVDVLQIRYEIFMNVERIYREIYMHIAWVSERDMLSILTYSRVLCYMYAVANGNYERYNRFKRQFFKREKLPTDCIRFRFLVSIT